MQPVTPLRPPTVSSAPWSEDSSFTRFPRAVAQQSASTTSSEMTVLMLLEPKDTDGPTVREEEHIPMMRSDDTENARFLKTGWSANIPTRRGSREKNAMSPPFSTIAWEDPADRSLSAMWTATAPATPAMGPTPATTDASHILLTSSSSDGDAS